MNKYVVVNTVLPCTIYLYLLPMHGMRFIWYIPFTVANKTFWTKQTRFSESVSSNAVTVLFAVLLYDWLLSVDIPARRKIPDNWVWHLSGTYTADRWKFSKLFQSKILRFTKLFQKLKPNETLQHWRKYYISQKMMTKTVKMLMSDFQKNTCTLECMLKQKSWPSFLTTAQTLFRKIIALFFLFQIGYMETWV